MAMQVMSESLTALDQFMAEVRAMPRYSREERSALAVEAGQGSRQAREMFVRSFLPDVAHLALARAKWYDRLEVMDIVQMGMELVLSLLDRALVLIIQRRMFWDVLIKHF